MLKLILGPSGSGKSRLMYETALSRAAAHPEKQFIVLVPEQFTLEAQRALTSLSPVHGILNIDVLSFTRLSYRVFEKTGVPKRAILTETGKSLLLRLIAEKTAGLSLLSGLLNRPGELAEIKSILSELEQYEIGQEELSDMITRCGKDHPTLSGKLTEIRALQKAFFSYMEGHYITAQMLLHVLTVRAPLCEELKGSEIFLDGYTGFTPAQLDVIEVLLRLADSVAVALTLDREQVELQTKVQDYELFALPKRTIQALKRICLKAGSFWEPEIYLDGKNGRYAEGTELAHLEKHLLRPGRSVVYQAKDPAIKETDSIPASGHIAVKDLADSTASPHKSSPDGQISLIACRNPYEEVRTAAVLIQRLTRQEGLHYRDIALVVGDLPTYAEYARRIFQLYGIPVFIDRSVPVVMNPAFEFVESALKVLDQRFSYEAMAAFFRTGFVFEREVSDRLENYVLAAGIRGKGAWSMPFTRETSSVKGEDVLCLEKERAAFWEKFGPFAEAVKGTASVRTFAAGLWKLFEAFELPEKLLERKEKARLRGEYDKEKEYGQVTKVIADVLDEAVSLIGEETVSRKVFEEILKAGLLEARIGIIPPGIDEVHVGDLERSRTSEIKVCLFLGLNDEYVPARRKMGGFLTNLEREFLRREDFQLSPTERENAGIQQYYLYLTLTRPRERLILSWSLSGMDGRSMRPSHLISQVRAEFPALTISEGIPDGSIDLIWSRRTGAYVLAEKISELPGLSEEETEKRMPEIREIAAFLQETEREREKEKAASFAFSELGGHSAGRDFPDASFVDRILNPGPRILPSLSPDLARLLYGERLQGSVSRLEAFARCPYLQFVRYGLDLKERDIFRVRQMDVGNVLHRAIELFSRRVHESGAFKWENLPENVEKAWSSWAMETSLSENNPLLFEATARSRAVKTRMQDILDRSLWAIRKQISAGSFEPEAFEVKFDTGYGGNAVKVDLGQADYMRLSGRIDRIDVSEDPGSGKIYVSIVDYKTGRQAFDEALCEAGIQMQLPVYLDAALQMEATLHPDRTPVSAGILYYRLQDPLISREGPLMASGSEQAALLSMEDDRLKEMRLLGLVNRDEAVLRRMSRDLTKADRYVPVRIKKDGTPSSRPKTASTGDFLEITEKTRFRMSRIGEAIYSGQIAPYPARIKGKAECQLCPYRETCPFDSRIDFYHEVK